MANPVQALVSTYNGGMGVIQSQFATFSFVITQAFEAVIPIEITCPGTTSISAGAEITVFRSTDYGATWESPSEGTLYGAFQKPSSPGQFQRKDIRVDTGWYLVQVQVGGGCASTWTAQQGTAWVISAYA